MANSFSSLGAQVLFPFEPSWADQPEISPVIMRRIITHRGTVQQVESTMGDVPVRLTLGFSLLSADDIFSMTEFFMARKGRFGRFWIMHPTEAFTLKSAASLDQNSLICHDNLAARQFQGYERIYINMTDGDVLIRKVTAIVSDQVTGTCELTLDTPLDRVINADNHIRIGRVYLVRFDQDDLSFNYATPDAVGDIRLSFYELVKEYAEL
jgi:hypothetical protein